MTTTKLKAGFWQSSGKNPFWITLVGEQVFWLGMNQASADARLGANWCHVGHGTIEGNRLTLSWADVPVGKDQLHGQIVVEIINETHLQVLEDSGNFGKSEWHWVSDNQNFAEFEHQ